MILFLSPGKFKPSIFKESNISYCSMSFGADELWFNYYAIHQAIVTTIIAVAETALQRLFSDVQSLANDIRSMPSSILVVLLQVAF